MPLGRIDDFHKAHGVSVEGPECSAPSRALESSPRGRYTLGLQCTILTDDSRSGELQAGHGGDLHYLICHDHKDEYCVRQAVARIFTIMTPSALNLIDIHGDESNACTHGYSRQGGARLVDSSKVSLGASALERLVAGGLDSPSW